MNFSIADWPPANKKMDLSPVVALCPMRVSLATASTCSSRKFVRENVRSALQAGQGFPSDAPASLFPPFKVLERWFRKKLQMQGAQKLRSEAYLWVRRNDEGEVQRRRWTFYETIKKGPETD
jgi:hypothetical protein